MKAIICAAGLGSRMYPLAQDKPKSLLTVQGETILGRQIRLLRECGVSDIIVIIGYLGYKIEEELKDQVTFCTSKCYDSTNSLFSLGLARKYLTDSTIVANADVLFTKSSLEALINNQDTFCLLIGKKLCNEEDHKVKVLENRITAVNKTMPPEEAFGEFIGLAKVRREGARTLRRFLSWNSANHPDKYWVSIFQNFITRGYGVNYALAQYPWIEIDTKEDYEEAQKIKW